MSAIRSSSLLSRLLAFVLGLRQAPCHAARQEPRPEPPPAPVQPRATASAPDATDARIGAPAATGPAPATDTAPAPLAVGLRDPAPVAVPAVQVKVARTIEDVRADIARLRGAARVRQAKVEAARDTSFAPTDFMDFAPSPPPVAASNSRHRSDAAVLFPEFDLLKGFQTR